MGSGMKSGLKSVLKYAGALFSLRTIYSTLSSSASSWLSSSNEQAQQLSANIDYMKYAMGSAFAPVIEYVTNLVYKLMRAIQSVIYSLTKVNIFASASASSYSSMADSAEDASNASKQLAGFDEINNLTDSSSSSSSSDSSSPSFDLSSVDTSSSLLDAIENGDWSAVGEAIAKKINDALTGIDWTGIQEKAKTIATNIGNFINGFVGELDWSLLGSTVGNGIKTGLTFANTLLTTINFTNIGSGIATFLNSAIDTALGDGLLGTTLGNAITSAIDTAYGFVTTFDWKKFGTTIGTNINSFFQNIDWATAGTTLGEGIKGVFDTITSTLQEINWSNIARDVEEFIKNVDWGGIATSLFTALGSALGGLASFIGTFISDAIGSAKEYFQEKIEECGGNVVQGIFKGIGDAISSIGTWINEHIFQPFINGFKSVFGINSPSTVMAEMGGYLIDGLKNGLSNIWNKVKEIFTTLKTNISTKFSETLTKVKEKFSVSAIKTHFANIVSNIKTKFTSIPTWFKDKFGTVWTNIKNKFNLSTIKTYFGNVLTGIKNKFSNIPTWFKDKFSSAWEKVKSVFSSGGKVFDGIKDGILNGLKTVINKLISGINKVIKVPFDGINKALNKIKNIEILGNKPFNNLISEISIPQIPTLATGNIATEETLAIFGEYSNARTNPEITAPQSTIYETMVQALNDSKFASSNNGTGLGTLVVKFGSYRVAYEIEDLIKKAHRANGTTTVTV